MKNLVLFFSAVITFAQRPADPLLLMPQQALELAVTIDAAPFTLPSGMTMGPQASLAFDSKGHMIILSRGPQALFEFDGNGKFIRAWADGMFTRTHGLRIDRDGNYWITDVGGHVVVKMNPKGDVLLTLGVKGEAGEWKEASGVRKFNQPTDVAIAGNGDVFIAQGHTAGSGDPRVIKFDKTGKFITSWGGLGTAAGKFTAAHGLAFDAKGQLWVADRENQRIQIFDQSGKFIREKKYAGLPCSIYIGSQNIYMVNGFAGQMLKLDLDGNVLAATGKAGKGPGEFGEAHFVTVSPKGEIYTADTVNSMVQKFVLK